MDQCASGVMKIGGEIRRSGLKEIVESAFEDGAGLDYGPAESHEVRRIIEVAAQNREPVVFFAEEAGFGAFERLETLCRELDLPYVRHSAECVGAWSEHIEFWEPEMDPSILTDTPAAAMTARCSIFGRSGVFSALACWNANSRSWNTFNVSHTE
jgi:hypothetical protein